MILVILGIIDILAGVSLIIPNFLAYILGIVVILKGISSILSIATGNIAIVAMGVLDVIAGIMLLLSFSFPIIWILMILKGFFSLVSGLGN